MCWLIWNVFFLFFIFQCSDYWCGLTKVYGQAVHRYIIRLPLTKNRIDEGTFLNAGSTPLHTCHSSFNRSHICPRGNKCYLAEARGISNAVITMYQIAESSIQLTHLASAAFFSPAVHSNLSYFPPLFFFLFVFLNLLMPSEVFSQCI